MANDIAYGFWALKDKFPTALTLAIPEVNTAIQQSLAEHNRIVTSLLGLFCERTTLLTKRFNTPTSGVMEELDEYAKARSIKPAGYYDLAWPLRDYGVASDITWQAERKMTVEDAARHTALQIDANLTTIRRKLMDALFVATGYSYSSEEDTTVTVKGLANSDTQVYATLNGAEAPATDNHLLAQSAAISDSADPFGTIFTELAQHPENSGGQIMALIPTNLKATTIDLAAFRYLPDPEVDPGANAARIVGSLKANVPGEVIGRHDEGCWIVEWSQLPSNYIVALSTGGQRALAMREDVTPSMRGFQLVGDDPTHPFHNKQWFHRFGFGAMNRVNALVYEIGQASYGVPTGYTTPQP